jgi:hypothetical protein
MPAVFENGAHIDETQVPSATALQEKAAENVRVANREEEITGFVAYSGT